jgi:hypothetical protein
MKNIPDFYLPESEPPWRPKAENSLGYLMSLPSEHHVLTHSWLDGRVVKAPD